MLKTNRDDVGDGGGAASPPLPYNSNRHLRELALRTHGRRCVHCRLGRTLLLAMVLLNLLTHALAIELLLSALGRGHLASGPTRIATQEHRVIILQLLLLTRVAVLGLADGGLAHHDNILLRSAAHLGGCDNAIRAETVVLTVVLLLLLAIAYTYDVLLLRLCLVRLRLGHML